MSFRGLHQRGYVLVAPIGLLAVGALVGASTARSQMVLIALIALSLALYVAARHPKGLVALTLAVALSIQSFEQLLGTSKIAPLDDVLVLITVSTLVVRRLIVAGDLRSFPGARYFAVYAVAGLASAVAHGVPMSVVAPGAFLALKGVLLGVGAAQLEWAESDVRRMVKLGAGLAVFALVCAVANFLLPQSWASHLAAGGQVDFRASFPSLIGPFEHPAHFGQVMALLATAVLAYRQVIRRGRMSALLLAACSFGVLGSLRRRAITGLGMSLAATRFTREKVAAVVVALVVVPILLLLVWGQLKGVAANTYEQYVHDGGQSARTVLYRGSWDVATSDAPLGAGFGRFGSHTAVADYSPLYYARGYQHIYGLQPGAGNDTFGSDTFWPSVLGESGFLGVSFFALGLAAIFRAGRRVALGAESRWFQFAGLVVLGWSVEYLIESIAGPAYVGPPTYPLLFFAAAVASASLSGRGKPVPEGTVGRGMRQ